MLPRYLRFARTVALVTAASSGCRDADPPITDAAGPAGDTSAHDAPPETSEGDAPAIDGAAETDADASAVTEGTCRILALEGGTEIACEAGSMCSYPESDAGDAGDTGDGDPVLCTYGIDAAAPEGGVAECGVVTCGANCYCAGPAVSLCGCLHLGSAGPLAPPELPVVTARRAARDSRGDRATCSRARRSRDRRSA